MKSFVKNLIKSILFLAALLICIFVATVVVRRKDSAFKYDDFFDKAAKNQIDVLFIGSSHVINGINPTVLFEEYGITSYNMGGHGSVMQATYWELMEALQYCKPKYVVVDTFLLQKDYQYLDVMYEDSSEDDRRTSVDQLHLNMDVWPLNDLKIAAVKDLIKDKDIQKEFLFDFIKYHGRWDELDHNDYKALTGTEERNNLFGAEMRYGMELTPGIYPNPEDSDGLGGDTVGEDYLRRIIDECQKNDIGIIVTFLTCSATTDDKRATDSARIISEEYDVPFFNMQELGVVDLYTDLNDTGHMNAMGAMKATRFVGDILSKDEDMVDHRGDDAYRDWQEKSDAFYRNIYELAVSSDNIYQQLNYLSSGDVSAVLYINDESQAFRDSQIQRLIHNFTKTPKIYHTDGPYIMINDVRSGKTYEASEAESLDGIETSLGTMHYQPVEHLFRLLYSDEDPDTNYLYDDSKIDYDIQIITYDNDTGEVLSHEYYRSYGCDYEK